MCEVARWLAEARSLLHARARDSSCLIGDLLLVRGRVLRSLDRLRLVEVIRVERASQAMLGLGEIACSEREPRALVAEIRAHLERALGSIPPVEVELRKGSSRSARPEEEAQLLRRVRLERSCEGYRHRNFVTPPRHVAAR
jgi:hypothetical protein